ncbi:MAG TPA: putative glycoside hydrolase, partial [Chloroflexota bacterium]
TREEVWDYNIALAVEAIKLGFDEVQFDYVRFPTDASAGNSLDSIRFSKPNTEANRMAAINGFLERAANAIHAAGGAVSADVFGYVVWRNDDLGIGQKLEEIAKRVDYVSPMIYPNLFWDGIEVNGALKYGDRKAGLYPYEIVNESMKVAVGRIGASKLRPWLEYYNDYITGKTYGPEEMALQKKATYDTGVHTWLFWDPTNRFAKGGFEPK